MRPMQYAPADTPLITAPPAYAGPERRRAQAHRALRWAPLPVIFLIASFLCPTEFSLYIGGLRLPPHRLALLILLPLALIKLISSKRMSLQSFDVMFIVFAVWTTYVYAQHEPDNGGFVYGGSLALESLGGYMVARAWIRDVETFRASLRMIGFAVLIAAGIALPETLLGKIWTHDFLASLTGYIHPTAVETRLGLTRAYGTFDHPIHYGTFCAGLLAVFWYAERRVFERRKKAVLLTAATFLGVSSAPLLCLGLQGALLVWERLTRGSASRVMVFLMVLTGLYIGMSMVSNRTPFALIATGMTLDSWTGFYRLQIWEAGLNNVAAHPWYGIGLADWERPWWMVSDTVDAFWLVIAMRSGLINLALMAMAMALLVAGVVKYQFRFDDPTVKRLAAGWLISLIALSLIGCTVHYWNVLHAYFFFFLGLGGWLADPKKSSLKPRRRKARAVV